MEEDPTLDLVSIQDGPAATLRRVHLVAAVPVELNTGLSVVDNFLVVEVAPDVAELELARPVWIELEEALDLGIHEVLVPLLHPRYPPAAHQRVLRFRL